MQIEGKMRDRYFAHFFTFSSICIVQKKDYNPNDGEKLISGDF